MMAMHSYTPWGSREDASLGRTQPEHISPGLGCVKTQWRSKLRE
jgi:hypothetical protein